MKSRLPPPIIPDGIGVNIHFVTPQAGQLGRLKEIGFRYARMDFKWREIETVPGTYDFSAYDTLTAALKQNGARPFYILDYGNPLYDGGMAPYTEAGRAAYARFAAAAARHFRGQDVIWEIWNEPNLTQFWKPAANPENYALLAVRAARELRAADPEACILAPGTSKFPWPYFETLFRNGLLREVDAISVHPYRDGYPESAVRDYLKLRQLIAANTPPGEAQVPIVCSEWGYPTHAKGVSEELQAAYATRQWLSNLAAGVNLSIYYDLMDDGDKDTEKEHRFGAVRFQTLEPKPLFTAAKNLIAKLNGYRFAHRLKTDSEHEWKLLFQRENNFAIVTWSSDPRADLAAQTPQVRVLAADDPEARELQLIAAVQYETAFAATPSNPAQLTVTLANPEGTPADVTVRVGGAAKILKLAPKGRIETVLSLPIQLAAPSIPVEVSWNGVFINQLPPIAVAPAWPLVFETNPDSDGVEIRVKNLLASPFRGELEMKAGETVTKVPLEIPAAGDQVLKQRLDFAQPLSLTAWDTRGVEMGRTRQLRFEPALGFPKNLGAASSLIAVESVEEVATPKAPLAVAAMEDTAPAPFALSLAYASSPGRLYTQAVLRAQPVIPDNATELQLWVRANNDGTKLRSRFKDGTGQTFQVDLGELNWQGWKRLRIPFYDGSTTSWGGANDGIPHLPLKWDGVLLLDGSRRPAAQNQVLLAAPYYVRAE